MQKQFTYYILEEMKSYKAIQNAAQIENQMEQVTSAYEKVLVENYHKYEAKLIDFLLSQVKELKKQIAINKSKTSQENIDSLITKKRATMQAKRQKEEILWRQLTEKFKKLQEEEKLLADQNKQAEFDVKNLNSKIQQFEVNNQNLLQSIRQLQNQKPDQFMTQVYTRQQYSSPYKLGKIYPTMKEKRNIQAKKHLQTNQNILFTKKYNLTEILVKSTLGEEFCRTRYTQNDSKSVLKQNRNNVIMYNTTSQNFNSTLKPSKHFVISKKKEILEIKQNQMKQKLIQKSKDQTVPTILCKGYSQMLKYLSIPQVRDKIFDILRK